MEYWDVLNRELGRLENVQTAADTRYLLEGLDRIGVLAELARHSEFRLDALVTSSAALNGQLAKVQVSVTAQLGGAPSNDAYWRILRQLGGRRVQNGVYTHRLLGSLSHQVGTALLAHAPINGRPIPEGSPTLPFADTTLGSTTKRGVFRQSVCRKIDQAISRFPTQGTCLLGLPKHAESVLRLVIGDSPVNTLLHGTMASELREMTWKSWLQLAQFVAEVPAPLFVAEIPVIGDRNYWLSGGRIDILVLIDPDGQPLRGRERTKAERILLRRPRHLPELIRMLPAIGDSIFLKVIDFKFQVGDAVQANRILSPGQVRSAPVPKHNTQVARYLAMGQIAYRQAWELKRTPWNLPIILFGELWYIFADQAPIVHQIELSAEGREGMLDSIRQQ